MTPTPPKILPYAELTSNKDAARVLTFWFGERASWAKGRHDKEKYAMWFMEGKAWDTRIREEFGALWGRAKQGELSQWADLGELEALALIVLLDQVSRNLGRHSADAFAQDAMAMAVAERVLEDRKDRNLMLIERAFVYMPFEHDESLESQDRCEALFEELVEEAEGPEEKTRFEGFLGFATSHKEIIERFGHFPHRNQVLGRTTTEEERAFMEDGGATFGQGEAES